MAKEVYPGEFYLNDEGNLVEIEHDDASFGDNPRQWDGNLGTFIGFQRGYDSPDGKRSMLSILDEADVLTAHDFDVWYGYEDGELPDWKQSVMDEEYEDGAYIQLAVRELRNKGYAALPVAVFDHSRRIYRVGTPSQFIDGQWDVGYFGLIFASQERMMQLWGKLPDDWMERAEAEFAQEVETYSDWAEGNVLGYRVFDRMGEEVDSCWGFIGNDASAIESYCGGLHDCSFKSVYEFKMAHRGDPDVLVKTYNQTRDEFKGLEEELRKQLSDIVNVHELSVRFDGDVLVLDEMTTIGKEA